MTLRPAAFLDRDGTIVPDTGFLKDPAAVSLLPGAADAIQRLRDTGHVVVVVTNQSGIARQLVSWDQYYAVARRIEQLLAEAGTEIDATYVCPHYPALTGPCACRKPGLANYRAAAARFGIDLARSVYVGDRPSDVAPAKALGGTGFLIAPSEAAPYSEEIQQAGLEAVADLGAAVARFTELSVRHRTRDHPDDGAI